MGPRSLFTTTADVGQTLGIYDLALRYRFGERESAIGKPGTYSVTPYGGVRLIDDRLNDELTVSEWAGRAIGGPRLAPRISPKKTWAGLAGGSVCSVVWSLLWLGSQSGSQSGASLALVAGVAVLTSVLAQIGDLSVSVVKRRFGVKDASGLLPGHGGVLDRLDGMLLTAPAAALALALLSAEGRWT